MRGKQARNLKFARDVPHRAVVEIPVGGRYQAHSWDLSTGTVVSASDGVISSSAITPDGQWLWWFDHDTRLWWRKRFGATSRSQPERPLRLRPGGDTQVLLGGDGTALVSRPTSEGGRTLALLPVGRIRPGTEPTFLGTFPTIRAFYRSRDESLVAVDTGSDLQVRAAFTGALLTTEPLSSPWRALGFMATGALLLSTQTRLPLPNAQGREPQPIAARWWNPRTGLRREIALEHTGIPVRIVRTYDDAGYLLEVWKPSNGGQEASSPNGAIHVYGDHGSTGQWRCHGPARGTIIAGTTTGGPGGTVYALWTAPGFPPRMVNLTAGANRLSDATEFSENDLGRIFPPAIGGVGGIDGDGVGE